MDITIKQGSTFKQIVRWESTPYVYKPVTAVAKSAPASVTSAAHGVPTGWRVAVQSVLGMKQINALNDPPKPRDFHLATVVDANTVTLDRVNALGYGTYISGGVLVYATPTDMTGFTARMQIRKSVASATFLAELTTENAGIAIDNVAKTITLTLTAVATAALNFTNAVYALEMVSATGVVTPLLEGVVVLSKEVTR